MLFILPNSSRLLALSGLRRFDKLICRFQVLCRRSSTAIAVVSFFWALQHAFMPLTFDTRFMLFRLLGSVPFAVFETLWYLRYRRLVPLAIAHALMDGATVLIPLLRA